QRSIAGTDKQFLYMEFVPGGSLEDFVEQPPKSTGQPLNGDSLLASIDQRLFMSGQVPPERSIIRDAIQSQPWPQTVAWLGMQLAESLASAHAAGVLHLDIKPGNIVLAADGLPKLTDFNVSVHRYDSDPEHRIGRGTLDTMSPEQLDAMLGVCKPGEIGEQSDIYSLAIVLWRLLTGELPWKDDPMERPRSKTVSGMIDPSAKNPIQTARENRTRFAQSPRIETADRTTTATLEAIRDALAESPLDRPSTAIAFARRLRLALHPNAARLISPARGSWQRRLESLPVWLVGAFLLMLPNVAAGFVNFYYNETQILHFYPEMRSTFGSLATLINSIAYPLALMVFFNGIRPLTELQASFSQSNSSEHRTTGARSTALDLKSCWGLGKQLATIGGVFWLLAGIAYPLTLRILHPTFAAADMLHFLLSLAICGGIAWTVPYFMGTLLGVLCYYPASLRDSLADSEFQQRRQQARSRSGYFVLAAAMIPLSAAALHTMRSETSRPVIGIAVVLTAVGLLFAFTLYQMVDKRLETLGSFLNSNSSASGSSPS
ncbi:MAG: protein kinase, partial [Planctomycetota bacterium]